LASFLHTYFVHYSREYSGEWQYGYKQAIQAVDYLEKDYDVVYMTTDLGRPYAYYLFYLQTSPEAFRKTALIRRSPFGFVDIDGFGKYRFSSDLRLAEKDTGKKVLYVDSPKKVPNNAHVLQTVTILNGNEVLKIYSL
jgi:hypothetical protein